MYGLHSDMLRHTLLVIIHRIINCLNKTFSRKRSCQTNLLDLKNITFVSEHYIEDVGFLCIFNYCLIIKNAHL